jgi:hypothetical protein
MHEAALARYANVRKGWKDNIRQVTVPDALKNPTLRARLFIGSRLQRSRTASGAPSLNALLQEKKFEPHDFYTGVDTPEDAEPLRAAVDNAIKDIGALSDPLEPHAVRSRLAKLIEDTDLYATADRDQVARYAIRIWRAAGFSEDSGLFGVSDEKVLSLP